MRQGKSIILFMDHFVLIYEAYLKILSFLTISKLFLTASPTEVWPNPMQMVCGAGELGAERCECKNTKRWKLLKESECAGKRRELIVSEYCPIKNFSSRVLSNVPSVIATEALTNFLPAVGTTNAMPKREMNNDTLQHHACR